MVPADFLLLLRRRLALILILTTAGLSFAIYSTSKITPMYAATATIFVSTPPSFTDPTQSGGNKLGDLATGNNFTQARVKSYATIINNAATLEPVIAELQLQIGVQELATQVSAVAPPNTVLMYVTAVNQDANLAAKISNAVANQFSETVLSIELNSTLDVSKIIKLSVVQNAEPNFNPVSPRKNFNYLLGLVAGAMLGLCIALFLRFLDKSMKSEKDLGDTPLLGVVAFDGEASDKPLIPQLGTYSIRTEAFRVFRTNMLHSLDSNDQNCIALSSCFSGEGKTTATLNLGFAIAQAGFSIVVVEADMRRPGIFKYLNNIDANVKKAKFGLSSLLSEDSSAALRKKISSATIEISDTNLDVILSGDTPDNPAELLGGQRFIDLVKILKIKYDYVLVDTPPVLAVADASIVGRVTENLALLVHAGSTSKRNFEAAREAIGSVGVILTGALLNKVPKHKAGEHYGYTYSDPRMGYYRYSYEYQPRTDSQNLNSVVKNKLKLPLFYKKSRIEKKEQVDDFKFVENDAFTEFLKKHNF